MVEETLIFIYRGALMELKKCLNMKVWANLLASFCAGMPTREEGGGGLRWANIQRVLSQAQIWTDDTFHHFHKGKNVYWGEGVRNPCTIFQNHWNKWQWIFAKHDFFTYLKVQCGGGQGIPNRWSQWTLNIILWSPQLNYLTLKLISPSDRSEKY